MKKLVSILLALAMILSLSVTAFAEDTAPNADTPVTYELTIAGITGHTYNVFQIYTGDIDKIGEELVISNVKYGQNHYPAVDGAIGDPVPDDELQNFINSADPANYFKSQINGNPYETINQDGTLSEKTITVEAGYYLIVDVTSEENLPDGQTKSPVLLKVAENITIASKHATILSEKKVDDHNDSTNDEDAEDGWQDSADYDIGDAVPFQLSVTLPSTLFTYNDYALTFHDAHNGAFDAPVVKNVYIVDPNGTTVVTVNTNNYTVSNECPKPDTCEFGGCDFVVTVSNIEDLLEPHKDNFNENYKLIVEYTAVLNNKANIGSDGNMNGMYVCHPDGHTPRDYVTVLTYALTVDKVDGASKAALPGAGFTLYKWNDDTSAWAAVGEELKGDDMTQFTWEGIDGGKYKLVETTTPAGYNTIADLEFVVDSTHKTTWVYGEISNSAFEDLIAKDPENDQINIFADAVIDASGHRIEDGKLEGNIENFKGVVLPETGAKGTFMLIACSSMFVMIAVVFMVTRKKMSIYED